MFKMKVTENLNYKLRKHNFLIDIKSNFIVFSVALPQVYDIITFLTYIASLTIVRVQIYKKMNT